ncbi:MAG: hypothetical protein RSD99_29305 [Janthinobacterium sp.]
MPEVARFRAVRRAATLYQPGALGLLCKPLLLMYQMVKAVSNHGLSCYHAARYDRFALGVAHNVIFYIILLCRGCGKLAAGVFFSHEEGFFICDTEYIVFFWI